MDTSKAKELIEKHQKGTLTAQEQAVLDGWYLKLATEQQQTPSEQQLTAKKDAIWKNLQVNRKFAGIARLRVMRQIAAAAIIVIAVGISFLFFRNDKTTKKTANKIVKNDILPGGNKAYLTLANGSKIALNNIANGQIANQAGTHVTKTAKGQLIYTIAQTVMQGKAAELNTVTTPHGGQWQVLLPDGTKVWLNAASALTYPVSFAGSKNRKITLIGEAYFEVSKDKTHPFIVHTTRQDVQVFGTHFNINAYPDEQFTKTTLLEGSVGVTPVGAQKQMLVPGEQSILTKGNIKVNPADTAAAVAWKNAMFYFENDDLEGIMRRVARWYDVKIIYKNTQAKYEPFSGRVSRAENVSEVLKMLSLTGAAQFKIEGREIIVTK